MAKPKFKEGDEVLVHCHCGCTDFGRGKVLECQPFRAGLLGRMLIMRAGKKVPDFMYRVTCSPDGWVPDSWVHPLPPTEPAMKKLNEQIGEWAKEAELEPA